MDGLYQRRGKKGVDKLLPMEWLSIVKTVPLSAEAFFILQVVACNAVVACMKVMFIFYLIPFF